MFSGWDYNIRWKKEETKTKKETRTRRKTEKKWKKRRKKKTVLPMAARALRLTNFTEPNCHPFCYTAWYECIKHKYIYKATKNMNKIKYLVCPCHLLVMDTKSWVASAGLNISLPCLARYPLSNGRRGLKHRCSHVLCGVDILCGCSICWFWEILVSLVMRKRM